MKEDEFNYEEKDTNDALALLFIGLFGFVAGLLIGFMVGFGLGKLGLMV